jgi:tetratricopeptide (TPR) repeat protein
LAIKSIKFNILILTTILFFLIVSGSINTSITKPKLIVSKENSAINVNNKILKIFSTGQSRLISDLLWITTLLESDVEHYKKRDLSSWMYLRFNSIIELDRNFLKAYKFGGKYLSIVKDDLSGADQIFSKGLQVFPNNYELLFNYGFLLAFEIGDAKRALPIYNQLITMPESPVYLKSIVNKLRFESIGDTESTLKILKNMYNKEPNDSFLKNRLKKDLLSLQIEIDIKCLNNTISHSCNRMDPTGQPYNQVNGKFQFPKYYLPYKLNRRSDAANKTN